MIKVSKRYEKTPGDCSSGGFLFRFGWVALTQGRLPITSLCPAICKCNRRIHLPQQRVRMIKWNPNGTPPSSACLGVAAQTLYHKKRQRKRHTAFVCLLSLIGLFLIRSPYKIIKGYFIKVSQLHSQFQRQHSFTAVIFWIQRLVTHQKFGNLLLCQVGILA